MVPNPSVFGFSAECPDYGRAYGDFDKYLRVEFASDIRAGAEVRKGDLG